MIGFKRKREIVSVPAFVLEHSCLGARGSAKKANCPTDACRKFLKKGLEAGEEVHRRSLQEISQPICAENCSRKVFEAVENCSRKVLEVDEEVHRKSLQENFPTDARRKSLKEGFGSWQRSPSKIAPRKFPNRCAKIIHNNHN